MPNLTIEEPIEVSQVAIVPLTDERLRLVLCNNPSLATFLGAFRNEFGVRISPAVGMIRSEADRIRSVAAFSGFRDAICVSAVVASRALCLKSGSPQGTPFSDPFDVYPWFLHGGKPAYISALTPATRALHLVGELRPQSAPAIGNRFLAKRHLDAPLLHALTERWEVLFGRGEDSEADRRLFRSLEMARAASKIPGGADASEQDAGRSVALWVSAFEILVRDKQRSNPGRVLDLLERVAWLRAELKARDHSALNGRRSVNLAGFVYDRLNSARNDFLHGNPLTDATLKVGKSQKQTEFFAGPLYRLALTAHLDLQFSEQPPDRGQVQEFEEHVTRGVFFRQTQRLAEDAILKAYHLPDSDAS